MLFIFVMDLLATWHIFQHEFVVLGMTGSVAYDPPYSFIPALTNCKNINSRTTEKLIILLCPHL